MRHHDTTGYNPQLIGSIPSEIGGLAALNYLYVGSNGLNGSIPSEIGELNALTYLSLTLNGLTGSIPELPPS